MNSPNTTDQVTRQQFEDAWTRAIVSNRFIFGFLGFGLFVLFVLGLGIGLVVHGLAIAFLTLVPIYNPAYRLFVTVFRLDGLPAHVPKPLLSRIFSFLIVLVVSGYLIYGGVKIFQMVGGFCDQSPICLTVQVFFRTGAP